MEAMTLATRVAVMNKGVIQQLAPPETIYNDPANLFVAGFIGSPSMNLISGELMDGTFRSQGLTVGGLGGGTRPNVVLGVRPEDVSVVTVGAGSLDAPVYAFELTGESVLVTVTVGGQQFCARGDRHFRCGIGEPVGIAIDPTRTYLFDATSENRIRF
jgi:multiple sugar transport system ATP-binding protein